jgi:hypothetical protein
MAKDCFAPARLAMTKSETSCWGGESKGWGYDHIVILSFFNTLKYILVDYGSNAPTKATFAITTKITATRDTTYIIPKNLTQR